MSDKPRQKTYARTIPHPLFERLIVDDAMNKESNEWKPERYHEYGYFPGCVDDRINKPANIPKFLMKFCISCC